MIEGPFPDQKGLKGGWSSFFYATSAMMIILQLFFSVLYSE